MCAKIAYVGKREIKSRISVPNKLGNWVSGTYSKSSEEDVMFIHNCNISISMEDAKELVARIKEVSEKVRPYVQVKGFLGAGTPAKKEELTFPAWDKRDDDDFWKGRGTYYGGGYNPSLGKPAVDYSKRSELAKAIITCNVKDAKSFSSVTELLLKEVEVLKGMNHGEIAESYSTIFEQNILDGGNNFLFDAYCFIYNRKHEDVDVDEITKELEGALNMYPSDESPIGIIGEAIGEAVDDYLLEINMIGDIPEVPEVANTK